MKNLFDVSAKVAVVTGGSRGIGAMIARGFVENGVKTYITARKEKELQETAQELSRLGECIAIASDLSTVEGVTAFADAVKARDPSVHILVNNAGATWGADIDEFPESGWDKTMDLNVKSMFFLTQQLLPALRAAGSEADHARVINIGSINGITHPHMNNYAYSASKAAVHQLTRNLARELANDHIRVNAIAPGRFFSKMTEYASQDKAQYEAEIAAIPLHRWGGDTDIAGVALMLATKAGAFITGEIIRVDGGTTLVS